MKSPEFDERLFNWIQEAREIDPDICDWIGVYLKASYYLDEESTDLILGPYIGADTEHTRIPISKGICGLALREEKTANIPDVKSHEDYISCSLETKSELVIPLKDKEGNFVAELDIDSHTSNAFTDDLVKEFEDYCLSFKNLT
jgi:putative methionine-R-sulfoxide reductase with GAF domain